MIGRDGRADAPRGVEGDEVLPTVARGLEGVVLHPPQHRDDITHRRVRELDVGAHQRHIERSRRNR